MLKNANVMLEGEVKKEDIPAEVFITI